MLIWLVERTDNVGWDEYDAFIIMASSELKARQLANEGSADEGHLWTDISIVKANPIGQTEETVERVVLGSFNAG